jgi:hypothetical protein
VSKGELDQIKNLSPKELRQFWPEAKEFPVKPIERAF